MSKQFDAQKWALEVLEAIEALPVGSAPMPTTADGILRDALQDAYEAGLRARDELDAKLVGQAPIVTCPLCGLPETAHAGDHPGCPKRNAPTEPPDPLGFLIGKTVSLKINRWNIPNVIDVEPEPREDMLDLVHHDPHAETKEDCEPPEE